MVAYFIVTAVLCVWWKSMATVIADTCSTVSLVISLQASCAINKCLCASSPLGLLEWFRCQRLKWQACYRISRSYWDYVFPIWETNIPTGNLPEIRDSDLPCCDRHTKVLKSYLVSSSYVKHIFLNKCLLLNDVVWELLVSECLGLVLSGYFSYSCYFSKIQIVGKKITPLCLSFPRPIRNELLLKAELFQPVARC